MPFERGSTDIIIMIRQVANSVKRQCRMRGSRGIPTFMIRNENSALFYFGAHVMSVLEAAARSPDSIAYYYCRVKTEMPGLELPPAYTTAYMLPDGLLHCENGPTPFIGRIKATSVPPPHTVASLKRALVQAEKLPDPSGDLTALFKTRDTRKPMGKGARVDILTGELGATPRTPVALVFLRDPEEALCVSDTDEAPWNDELPIVYYRLYNRGGEEHSECAFDRREPALATINRDSIAPPRNALCVKRRIAKLEGKPIYKLADLFINTTTDDPRSSTDVVDDTQGSSRDKPLLVVLPERRPGLYNQPVLIVKLPSNPAVDMEPTLRAGCLPHRATLFSLTGWHIAWSTSACPMLSRYTRPSTKVKTRAGSQQTRHTANLFMSQKKARDVAFSDIPGLCLV
ncbi:hypothetical protein C8F04DRAFT_1404525 [Mycena alexandri]|uniref:Uncharacterized protein n=1 Tax=Mycena alexandri TaxID=1745969 RepID=A0AAD6WNC3_9AGAR|nr:hypothetical protein C8F04DRAFT_1404525 [Mycena alexandri]